jgi:hypothetical protein
VKIPFKRHTQTGSVSRTWVPAGHFYSTLVDPSDEHVRAILKNFDEMDLPENSGIDLAPDQIVEMLRKISSFYGEMPFPDTKSKDLRYFFENGRYEWGDGAVYFGMIRHLKPKRIYEVGSGFSSCLAMDTNDLFFERSIDLRFIEPYPDVLLGQLGSQDPYRENLICSKVQDVPLTAFRELEANDILFIDSSHVSKLGSDVNDYMFRILPALQPGVVIHIHDIPYPLESKPDWITPENRSWNEPYLLRAFLQYNSAFKIIYYNHYVYRKFRHELATHMPSCLKNPGAAIWIRKLV